jgi:transposase
MTARENSATMRVVWDALSQVIREVLCLVLVLVIGEHRHLLWLIYSRTGI